MLIFLFDLFTEKDKEFTIFGATCTYTAQYQRSSNKKAPCTKTTVPFKSDVLVENTSYKGIVIKSNYNLVPRVLWRTRKRPRERGWSIR